MATHGGTLIDGFLNSYFPDVPYRAFEDVKAVASSITSELWERWVPGIGGAADLENTAGSEYQDFMTERRSQRGRGVDGPPLFCRLMPGLATPYSLSRVAYQGGPAFPSEVS